MSEYNVDVQNFIIMYYVIYYECVNIDRDT